MPRPNKILFLTNDFPPAEGGMETCAYEISSELMKQGFELIIAVNQKKNIVNSGKDIIWLQPPANYFFKILYLFIVLFFISLRNRPDLIYLNTWSPFGLPAALLSFIFRVPYFITCHGLDIVEPRKSFFHLKIMRYVFNRAKKIICVSNYTAKLAVENVPEISDKIKIINNGVNVSKFFPLDSIESRKKINVNNDSFILLTVSRLTPRKGHLHIIKELKKLKEKIPEVQYLIVGRGPAENDLKSEVISSGLEKQVIFAGFVPDDKLIFHYNSCDVFIMLSDEIIDTGDIEGFGVSYLEANACGKPAVALNRGGAGDAVKNGVNGYLIDGVSQFSDIILQMYSDQKHLTNIGVKSLDHVRAECSWQKRVKEYINVFIPDCCENN